MVEDIYNLLNRKKRQLISYESELIKKRKEIDFLEKKRKLYEMIKQFFKNDRSIIDIEFIKEGVFNDYKSLNSIRLRYHKYDIKYYFDLSFFDEYIIYRHLIGGLCQFEKYIYNEDELINELNKIKKN